MSTTVLGISGAIQQPDQERYAPGRGWYTVRVWRGQRDSIVALANILAGQGYALNIRNEAGGVATLEAEGAQLEGIEEQPEESWELSASSVEKDVLAADVANVNNLTDEEKRIIKKYTEQELQSSPALAENSTAEKIYKQMLGGLKAVRVFSPTLRHIQVVSRQYSISQSLTNVGKVIPTANIATLEGVPTLVIPIGNFPSSTGKANMAYGWYKNFPTISATSRGKVQITQEWEFGLWSTLVYTHV